MGRRPRPPLEYLGKAGCPYNARKVLVPKAKGCASMTVARFVPWGIEPEHGIALSVLAKYLGVQPSRLRRESRAMGHRQWYEPAAYRERKRCPHGKRLLVSEADAAKLIVCARVRQGQRQPSGRRASAARPDPPDRH